MHNMSDCTNVCVCVCVCVLCMHKTILPAAVTTTMLLATASLMATSTASVFGPIKDMEITDRLSVCLARSIT